MQANADPIQLPDDSRLMQAVQEFLDQLEAGRRPSRQEFLLRYADLAAPLGQCLDGLELVHKAAGRDKARGSSAGGSPGKSDVLPANPLGDFQIVREIGRGGMGVVYEAVQLSLGRRVALKVLPFAAALDPKQLQRFHNEAQAAAHLNHPNIVPVHAVGTERGVHYYAMQFIEGQSLDALIDGLRRSASTERHALASQVAQVAQVAQDTTGPYAQPAGPVRSQQDDRGTEAVAAISTERATRGHSFFRRVAALGVTAAEALEHAHQVGVVHRDIKPANLLLDVQGNLWITDFGLATAQNDVGLTISGEILGTLRYMSPEQALAKRGMIDHRTDVYSLGVTLYELLTLERLFDGRDRQELLQQIALVEPRPPRLIDRTIPVELETILLKAIAKSPSERYLSAQDLADDLRRFLNDQPIRARRPSLLDRAVKWSRRHRPLVASAAALVVLGLAALSVSTVLVARAYDRERAKGQEARDSFHQARRAVDTLIQIGEEELGDKPHLESVRKRLLEAALAYYQEFIEQRRDDPNAQAELATTHDRVKRILDELAVLEGDRQLFLLNEQTVLDDLQLTEDQRQRIADHKKRSAKLREESFFRVPLKPEERRQVFLDLARNNEAAIADILSVEQRKRLRQIALQLQGPMAFREPDIVAALKLTAEQRESIRAVVGDVFIVRMERPPGPLGKPPERPFEKSSMKAPEGSPRQAYEVMLKAGLDQIKNQLTAEQLQRWEEMVGKPFQGPIPLLSGPPRPFGPPGPRP